MIFSAILNVVRLHVGLSSGRLCHSIGSEKNGSLFTCSVLANGTYRSVLFLNSVPMSLCLLLVHVLWSAGGLYWWYMECISVPLLSVIR